MMSRLINLRKTTYLSLMLAITACGGSGGSSFSPPNLSSTPIAISSSNQYDVVASGTMGANGTATGAALLPGGVVISGASGTPGFNVFDFASGKLLSYISINGSSATALPAGVTVSDQKSCESGNISYTINVSDPNSNTLISGDSASLSFNSCTNGGTTISGSISLSVNSGTFDPACTSACADVSLSINFNDVTAKESSGSATIHGGFTLAKTGSTSSFSGSSLYLIAPTAAVQLSNFDISTDTSTDTMGTLKTTTVTMTVASSLIDGSFTMQTASNAPLQQYDSEMYPHAGTLIFTGSNNSSLTVDYLDETSVQLTLDADGDGNTDANYPVTVTWTVIEAAVTAN